MTREYFFSAVWFCDPYRICLWLDGSKLKTSALEKPALGNNLVGKYALEFRARCGLDAQRVEVCARVCVTGFFFGGLRRVVREDPGVYSAMEHIITIRCRYFNTLA
jgi:hypothetical protein